MCNIFPTINVSGTLRHLLLSPPELSEYEEQAERTLTRYLKRLQWLLGGLLSGFFSYSFVNYQYRNL